MTHKEFAEIVKYMIGIFAIFYINTKRRVGKILKISSVFCTVG